MRTTNERLVLEDLRPMSAGPIVQEVIDQGQSLSTYPRTQGQLMQLRSNVYNTARRRGIKVKTVSYKDDIFQKGFLVWRVG